MRYFTDGVIAELENFHPLTLILYINDIIRGKKEYLYFIHQGKKFRLKLAIDAFIVDEVY